MLTPTFETSKALSDHPSRRSRRLDGRLLVQHGLLHDGILAGHAAPEGAFDLGAQRQLAPVVALLRRGHEALLLQGFVLETLEAVAEVGDLDDARIVAGQTADGPF